MRLDRLQNHIADIYPEVKENIAISVMIISVEMCDVISVEMCVIIVVISLGNIMFNLINRIYYSPQFKAIVSHTGLQTCQQLLSGHVLMISHDRKLSSN